MSAQKIGKNAFPVQSVGRALQIIDLLAEQKREMALTEIAQTLEWPKSTTYGLIATLREFCYVDQSDITGKYRLGTRLFELGNIVARSWDIKTVAVPIMRTLSNLIGETVHLAVEDNGEVLYLEKVEAAQMFSIVSEIGSRLPMHCTGLGKVLLAYKSEPEVKWILSKRGLDKLTQKTITDKKSLMQELSKVRKQGYATDDGEIMDSLSCIAVPIFNKDKKVQYALSVSRLPSRNEGFDRAQVILEKLQNAAADISFAMGYREEE